MGSRVRTTNKNIGPTLWEADEWNTQRTPRRWTFDWERDISQSKGNPASNTDRLSIELVTWV